MDNYEILETIHKSKTGETIVFKVKEKNKKTWNSKHIFTSYFNNYYLNLLFYYIFLYNASIKKYKNFFKKNVWTCNMVVYI